jgi:hypothetical protein
VPRQRDIPYPPGRPPARPPALLEQEVEAWRLHHGADPTAALRHKRGKFRFDAPAGEYPVTYGNEDDYACFAEVYGDSGEIAPSDAGRYLSAVRSTRPLRLLALDDSHVLAALGLDLRIATTVDYARSRLWGLRLHEWYPDCDGLRYLGRHAARHLNFCLFLDRCAGSLEPDTIGRLADLRYHVIRAAEAYNLAPRLFEERDRGGWP